MRLNNQYQTIKLHTLVGAWTILIGLLISSCDVHEFPKDKNIHLTLRLKYTTDMPWTTFNSGNFFQRTVNSRSTDLGRPIRCIVRLYGVTGGTRADVTANYQEYIYYSSSTDSTSNVFPIDIPQGDYQVMAWADFANEADGTGFYNADDFADIKVPSPYIGNTDYKDAFSGTAEIRLADFLEDRANMNNKTITIEMSRPLAKYEFISTDLEEFMAQEAEAQKKKAKAGNAESQNDEDTKATINLNNYSIRFFYDGYVPSSYSMFTDKPVDAITGVSFAGTFNVLSDDEVSLGFDYVMVNHKETTITVKMGLFNQQGELISLTNPIDVPLKRSTHTLVRGRFLMEKSNNSVTIDPSYEDDYNIIL